MSDRRHSHACAAPFDQLVPGAVDSWLGATGEPAAVDDPALARLALAVVRGLLLYLVGTGAGAETTEAPERFVALLRRGAVREDRSAASPGPDAVNARAPQ
jgi:hypothetical protein